LQHDESRADIFVRFLWNFPRTRYYLSLRFMKEDASELDDDSVAFNKTNHIRSFLTFSKKKTKEWRGIYDDFIAVSKRNMRDETVRGGERVVKIFRTLTDTFRKYRGTNFGNPRRTRVNISKHAILCDCDRTS